MPQIFGRSHNVTTDDVYRVEKWAPDITMFRESNLVMGKWVQRFDAVGGDVLNLPQMVKPPAPGTITANGDVTDTTPTTETNVSITVNTPEGYIINIPDQLSLQSKYDLVTARKKAYGYRMGERLESVLLALVNSLAAGQDVGDVNSGISIARILTCWKRFRLVDVPTMDNHLVFAPGQYEILLDTEKLTKVDSIAYPKGESPFITAEIGQIFGFRCAWSNQVAASTVAAVTGLGNIAFQREALVLATNQTVKVEPLARTLFSQRIGISMHYGTGINRGDHALRVLSKV